METWKVKLDQEGIRLSDFLRENLPKHLSAKAIKRHVEANRCLVNGTPERFASKRLMAGDRVKFDIDDLGSATSQSFEAHRILYEDEDILLYNKPAGLTCDAQGILKALKVHGSYILVHRLDKETSGVLLLAKNSEIEKTLLTMFRQRQIHKRYLSLNDGYPKDYEGVIKNYLGKVGGYSGQTIYGAVPKEKGEEALTVWKLKKASKNVSMIETAPETGRTHQIRAHLKGMGHPILGDYQYAKKFRTIIRPLRVLLHATSLTFKHPRTGEHLSVEAPLPDDFKAVMKEVF